MAPGQVIDACLEEPDGAFRLKGRTAFIWMSLSMLLPIISGCSENGGSNIDVAKDFQLKDIEIRNLKWDHPEDSYRIGLGFIIVKLSKDVDDDRRRCVAMSTRCPKDGLHMPVLYLEKILHCPGCGSDFDFRGARVRGPATEDLLRYKIRQDPTDGKIHVGLTMTFKHEDGGWKNPESYFSPE